MLILYNQGKWYWGINTIALGLCNTFVGCPRATWAILLILKSGAIAFQKSLWWELNMQLKQLFCAFDEQNKLINKQRLTKGRDIATVADMDSEGTSVGELDGRFWKLCYFAFANVRTVGNNCHTIIIILFTAWAILLKSNSGAILLYSVLCTTITYQQV